MTDLEIIAIFFTFLASLVIVPCIVADIHTKYTQNKD
jgi:hypothetical protein